MLLIVSVPILIALIVLSCMKAFIGRVELVVLAAHAGLLEASDRAL